MSIFYYKMWDRIEQAGYSKIAFARRVKISSATLNKMRNNEYVSLETIDRIREELGCDYGDILSSVPKSFEDVTEYRRIESSAETTEKARTALNEYMKKHDFSVADIAKMASISVNTIKRYLNGKALSAQSHIKLMRLGDDYQQMIGTALKGQLDDKKKYGVYCKLCGRRGKGCWAARSIWLPNENRYEDYCALGFEQLTDENGELRSPGECPHPTNMLQLEEAKKKYPYQIRDNIKAVNPSRNGGKWYDDSDL